MKAAVLEDVERLAVRDLPTPRPEEGSIILRVKACSICGTDLRIYHHGHPRIKLPHVLGHEIAGEIAAIGGGVAGYQVGDRVAVTPRIACGHCYYCRKGQPIYCTDSLSFGYQLAGGYAEYMLVPRRGVEFGVVNEIADGVSFEEAALAETLACCLRAQLAMEVGRDDTVVVVGGGPVGVIHCRLVRVRGAGEVVLVEIETGRLSGVDLTSVDRVVDARDNDVVAEVLSLTCGRGVDVVIVACSAASAQGQSLSLAGRGGVVNLFGGLPPGQSNVTIDSNIIHYSEVLLTGSHGSTPDDNRQALDMLGKGLIKVGDLVTHTFPLDSIAEAFAFADSRQGMHTAILP